MVYVKKGTSTIQQMAYAKRVFSGQGQTKKEIALDCGYSPNVANSPASHIENKKGFHNAMSILAKESNDLAVEVMHQFKARGFDDFTNSELTSALTAIGNAWSKFNASQPKDDDRNQNPSGNKLRNVILQQVENQTIVQQGDKPLPPQEPIPGEVVENTEDPMDF